MPRQTRRFRLPAIAGGFLLAMACTGTAVWLGVIRPTLRREQALAAFDALGAEKRQVIGGPAWLGLVIRRTFFLDYRELWLKNTTAGDADMAHVASFPGLSALSLEGTRVGDGGLAPIAALRGLRTLYLGFSRVTGEGLPVLGRLPELEYLSLEGLQVKDEHLRHLAGLGRLRHLGLDGTLVTGAGLAQLPGLERLETLWLDRTWVDASALGCLERAVRLTSLHLRDARSIGNDFLDLLPRIPSLRRIDLAGTWVTVAGLEALAAPAALEELCVDGNQATPEDIEHLATVHPLLRFVSKIAPPKRPDPPRAGP